MIPDPLAMGSIVTLAALVGAHLSVRAYLIVLGLFAFVWIFASQALSQDNPDSLALVVLMFLLAAGLTVAASVQLLRILFAEQALGRWVISLAALVGSVLATMFMSYVFSG